MTFSACRRFIYAKTVYLGFNIMQKICFELLLKCLERVFRRVCLCLLYVCQGVDG